MRLDLRATLVSVEARTSVRHRLIVMLKFAATGQPELPSLLDIYAVDHPVGRDYLRWVAERKLGVHLPDLGDDAEAYVAELNRLQHLWREVTLVVEERRHGGQDHLAIRRIRQPDEVKER